MEKQDIEELRAKVSCAYVLEDDGWEIDVKESTARAVKYRRGDGEITIVIHGGMGWFDPLSERKGDVFLLARDLFGLSFPQALEKVASLVGFVSTTPAREMPVKPRPQLSIVTRWQRRRAPAAGTASWRYLAGQRSIPPVILSDAVAAGLLREGPHGSMWAAHTDGAGQVTGWEERGPHWRGFSTGGAKALFCLGDPRASRICVTEAAIDAMSLAAIEALRPDALYVSTGGGWSPLTAAAIRNLATRRHAVLVAATDRNRQGDAYAARLMAIADDIECEFLRLVPISEDWNQDLCRRYQTVA